MLTKLSPRDKTKYLRHEIIHQTLIRLQATRKGDSDTANHASIERGIAISAIEHVNHKKKK